MEILNILIGIGLVEGLFICYTQYKRNALLKSNNLLIDTLNKAQELEKKTRRDVEGTFHNPLQDGYRKNSQGLYEPVKPTRNPYAIRPHLGDDEKDEV